MAPSASSRRKAGVQQHKKKKAPAKRYPSDYCRSEGCSKRQKGGGFCIQHGGCTPCKYEGCSKQRLAGGYCGEHGGGTTCKFDGCNKWQKGGGFCIQHGGGTPCKSDGCNTQRRARGYCGMHGGGAKCKVGRCNKARRTGGYCGMHGGGRCKFEGCTNQAQRAGLCKRHGANDALPCAHQDCKYYARNGKEYCRVHLQIEGTNEVSEDEGDGKDGHGDEDEDTNTQQFGEEGENAVMCGVCSEENNEEVEVEEDVGQEADTAMEDEAEIEKVRKEMATSHKHELDAKLSEASAKFSRQINELKSSYEDKLAIAREKFEQLSREYKDMENKISDIQASHFGEIKCLKESQRREMKDAEEEWGDTQDGLEKELEARLVDLKASFECYHTMERNYLKRREIGEAHLIRQNSKAIKSLADTKYNYQREVERVKQMEKRLDEAKASHTEEMRELKEKLKESNNKVEELKTKMVGTEAAHFLEIERLKGLSEGETQGSPNLSAFGKQKSPSRMGGSPKRAKRQKKSELEELDITSELL